MPPDDSESTIGTEAPLGAAMVALLVEAGADVNSRFTGPHTETPLHWAASSC